MIKFTSSNVTSMEDEIVEVLNKYGFKNVTFTGNTRSFTPTETTFKILANINGVKSSKQEDLERHAKIDGIDVNKVGPKGEILVDYHARKHTYPYIMRRGKREYKLNAHQARSYFGV